MNYKGQNYWALILGASSGFGLATAKKLAGQGMNIIAVHRDRRGSMERINGDFDQIRANGVELIGFNVDALNEEVRTQTIDSIREELSQRGGKLRLLLHSIAFGNLKLMTPRTATGPAAREAARHALAEKLGVDPKKAAAAINELFEDGVDELRAIADEPEYDDELLLEDEDLANTIYAMGTSLVSWVQAAHVAGLFAEDARVLSMTSEGNEIAWRAYGAVSAAKTALESVSRSIALEFAPHGLRCNVIQAGVTDTPALRLIPGNSHLKARMRLQNPYRRLTTPEDVADFVALMCTPEAAWVNGVVIRVDGGEHIAG